MLVVAPILRVLTSKSKFIIRLVEDVRIDGKWGMGDEEEIQEPVFCVINASYISESRFISRCGRVSDPC